MQMQCALYWLLLTWVFTIATCIPLSESSREEANIYEDDYNKYCKNQTITLNFENIVLSNIGRNFIASPLISCLSLKGNRINTISSLAFDKLPNLTYLDLTNNNWKGQQMLSDGGHKTLKTLILENVLLGYQEYSYVTGKNINTMCINSSYPALEKLFLRNNGLTHIVGSYKADFSKLAYLYLSNNKIKAVRILDKDHSYEYRTDNDFSWLPKSLKYLELDNNYLETLSLTNMNELEFLSVNNNKLESLLLQNLNKLKEVSTDGNKLASVSLKNLNGLKKLALNNNNLKDLSNSQFQGISKLEDLNLSNNKISDFDGRIVDFIPKLQNLTLENNLFTDIPIIRDAPNLQLYSLRCNKIRRLGSGQFSGMRNLKFLYLSNNEISEINPDTFSLLEKLETLSLGRNRISNLPSEWMLKMQNLRLLNLEENLFTNLEALKLNDSPSLMQLFLQNNPLKYLRAHSLDSVPENITIELDMSLSVLSDCKKNDNDQG